MRQLLIINPNNGQTTTDRLQSWISRLLPADVHLKCITARFGASYIACEASAAVAGHALLDAWAHHLSQAAPKPDGILIGCFGDPGLFALRASSACPVSGLAEASFIQASALGQFAIVTGGVNWPPMLRRLAQSLGFEQQLTAIEVVTQTGAQLLADRDMALRVLAQACEKATQSGAKSIVIGGAGLAGYAQALQDRVRMPLIDSVSAGVDLYLNQGMPPAIQTSNGFESTWNHLPVHMNLTS